MTASNPMIRWVYDDGGREAAGFKGEAGDCVVRAIAIASHIDYRTIYDDLYDTERAVAAARNYQPRSPRQGVKTAIARAYLDVIGFRWVPTMSIGSGTTVHLRADELPHGRVIARCSKHFAAVIDGVLRDTFDCSRDGTRAVYGYWVPR